MKIKETFSNILQTTEKYTGLDNIYFFKNTFFSSIQQIMGLISGLAIIYFFGHFATKSLFGQYNLILSILGLLTILSLPGIDNALIQSVGAGFDSSIKKAVQIKIKWSLLAVPFFLGFGFYYYFIKGEPYILTVFLIAILLFPFFHSFGLINEFLTAKKKFKVLTFFLSLSSILTAVLICLSIFYFQSLYMIIISYFLGTIVPSVLCYIYSLKFIRNRRVDKKLFSYGLFLSCLAILPWLSGYLGQVLLAYLLGFESLAIYSAASKFPMNIQKNLFIFYKPVTAKIASQNTKQHLKTIDRHWWKLVLWGFLLFFLVWLLIPFLINFFFTKNYHEAINYARLLSIGIIPLPLTWVISDIFLYQKKGKEQVIIFTIPQIIKLVLFIILIPLYGIAGLVFTAIFDRYFTLGAGLLMLFRYKLSS